MSGYRWADATQGNLIAKKHGAWSPRFVDALADELVEAIAPTVTWWQPCDTPAIWAWAQCVRPASPERRIRLPSLMC
jgi:hypothetical protein